MSAWDVEGVEARAVDLYRQGFSATQIAKALHRQFKVSISRNAVIGKMHRLHVKRPGASTPRRIAAAPKPKPAPRKIPERPVRPVTIAPGQAPAPKESKAPYVPQTHAAPAQALLLADLGPCQCRWPVGAATGEDQRFCASPYADDGRRQPYCDQHVEASVSRAWKEASAKGKNSERELFRSVRKIAW